MDREERVTRMDTKTRRSPCYFYNTGGCFHANGTVKESQECKYLHVKVDCPMEKPEHLRPPCRFYHLRGFCIKEDCMFGHSDITEKKWKYYFGTAPWPGMVGKAIIVAVKPQYKTGPRGPRRGIPIDPGPRLGIVMDIDDL